MARSSRVMDGDTTVTERVAGSAIRAGEQAVHGNAHIKEHFAHAVSAKEVSCPPVLP